MADSKPAISTHNIAKLANQQFGTKSSILHYAKLGREAASRANAAMSVPNSISMAAEITKMAAALEAITDILGDDSAQLTQEK